VFVVQETALALIVAVGKSSGPLSKIEDERRLKMIFAQGGDTPYHIWSSLYQSLVVLFPKSTDIAFIYLIRKDRYLYTAARCSQNILLGNK